MKKKFVSIVLTLALVLSMSVTAFAADKGDKNAKDASKASPKTAVEAISFSASDAENAALAVAELTRSEVKSLHAYGVYDANHQVTTYRVEFAVFDSETFVTTVHSYVISIDGEVLSGTTTVVAHR